MVRIWTDEDLPELIDAAGTVTVMRQAILAAHHGTLAAPARVHAELGDGRLTYTAGATPSWFGYRSYDTVCGGEQIVAVHKRPSGDVAALAVGVDLGRMRTGAIGGVAADTLAAPEASTIGLIGTGPQAWMQLWAISAVRSVSSVRVHSRSPERRARFAASAAERHGITVTAAGTAEEAVDGAEIVVLATSSGTPVVDTGAIAPDAFVTTLGPKQAGHAEFDVRLAERASTVVTDSIAQLNAYDPPNILVGTPHADRAVSLGAILAGETPARPGSLFCSVGLAGTEAYLLAHLAGM